jgi:hypothetical protein
MPPYFAGMVVLVLAACSPAPEPISDETYLALLRSADPYQVGGPSYAYPALGYPVYEHGMQITVSDDGTVWYTSAGMLDWPVRND